MPKRLFSRGRSGLGLLCVATSLGLHGLLLVLVWPSPSPPPAVELTEEPVLLEDVAVAVVPRPAAASPPNPAIAPPVAAPVPAAPALAAVRPAPAPAAPAPAAPAPAAPAPSAAAPDPAPEQAFTPPPPPPEEVPAATPYADFPHLEGAEATCGEVSDCWRSPVVTSWRSAARDLERRLAAQGYAIADVTGQVIDIDSGVQVYAVSKPGEPTYYLNFISVGDGVLYTMTNEPMNIEEILYFQRS